MAASLPRTLYGTDEAIPESVTLGTGGVSLDLRGAKVWHIRCGDHEVWHGVAFLFRDADWGTPEPVVDEVRSTLANGGFDVDLIGRFPVTPPIQFRLRIAGNKGRIRFEADATPEGDIRASRLGLCVMHPMSVCGAPIEVEHTDGRLSRSTFPTLIPPWPPFMLIRSIRHEYAPGAFARCTFEGDAFELEDQRNNSDASFKTYSRSNLMPRPYWVRQGIPIRQSVELVVEAPPSTPRAARRPGVVRVGVGAPAGVLPRIGIEVHAPLVADATTTSSEAQSREVLASALRVLRPAHLHVALADAGHAVDWLALKRLLAAADAALRLDVSVDYANVERLDILARAMQRAGVAPSTVAIFPTEARCLDAARLAFPNAHVGGGTPHFFVQLNRIERLGPVEFLSFTTSPIVHGADDENVMLTLSSLPSMIETLRARYPDARFHVGPSTIGARRSPLGDQPETDGLHRIALARDDPRCRGLFGAAWVLGYAAHLTCADVDAVTLMSATGPSGLVSRNSEGQPETHPAFWVLQRLGRSVRVRDVVVSDSDRVMALALERDSGVEILLANLTRDALDVDLDKCAAASCAILDAEACATGLLTADVWESGRRPFSGERLRLGPYAVASVVVR